MITNWGLHAAQAAAPLTSNSPPATGDLDGCVALLELRYEDFAGAGFVRDQDLTVTGAWSQVASPLRGKCERHQRQPARARGHVRFSNTNPAILVLSAPVTRKACLTESLGACCDHANRRADQS